MSNVLSQHCLVLNKSWEPLGTVSLKRAIVMLFSTYENGEPKARIIEHPSYAQYTWDDWSKLRPSATDEKIKSGNLYFRVPEIILLTKYDRIPQPKVHFSRRNIFKRDEAICQYCGIKLHSEWTIDHVNPRSKGGITSFDNCVCCCIKCNSKKADRTLEECGFKLLKKPKKPHPSVVKISTSKRIESWSAFVSEAYWLVDIGDE